MGTGSLQNVIALKLVLWEKKFECSYLVIFGDLLLCSTRYFLQCFFFHYSSLLRGIRNFDYRYLS